MKGFVLAVMVFAMAAASGCPQPALACHRCGRSASQCIYRAQAIVQPVVAYQSVNYFIGAPIRAEAAIAEALRADPAYQEFVRFKAWKDGTHGQPTPAAKPADPLPQPTPDPLPAAAEFQAVQTNCAKCHSGATPAGKITIDGVTRLSPADANRAQLAVLEGRMPKKGQLTPEARGEVLADLIFLAKPPAKELDP